jgi:hypothetical protein
VAAEPDVTLNDQPVVTDALDAIIAWSMPAGSSAISQASRQRPRDRRGGM